MKGLVPFLAFLLPATTFAASAGHDVCSGSLQGQKIQLLFATGALCCDASVKIGRVGSTRMKTYKFPDDTFADEDGFDVFSAKSNAGSIHYIVGYGDKIEVVLLSAKIGNLQFDNRVLICKKLDFSNPMAN